MDDPFVLQYDESERKIAAEFLTNWIPYLSKGFCSHCSESLIARVRALDPGADQGGSEAEGEESVASCQTGEARPESSGDAEPGGAIKLEALQASPASPKARMSWADMAQEDDDLAAEEDVKQNLVGEDSREGGHGSSEWSRDGREEGHGSVEGKTGQQQRKHGKPGLSREKREYLRVMNVVRKKDFICLERVNGKIVNILDGLELHKGVFSAVEQNKIVDFVYELQKKGRNGEFGEHTYSEPQKWMRGKGRVTIQFGCCYNYAMDKNGNPPGILRHVVADPLPPLFKMMIKRLVQWHVLPPTCIPDSCIVNIYEPGDCIPPHIDSHDFVRPFCTVSFLSECNIVFGSKLKIEAAGEFSGAFSIPLPLGSVLVLNGNGADVAKHCVPAVRMKRISITFRKMDESLHPFDFKQEPDLQSISPLPYGSDEDEIAKKLHNLDLNSRHRSEDDVLTPRPSKHLGSDSQGTGSSMRSSGKRTSHRGGNRNGESGWADASTRKPNQLLPSSDLPGLLPLPVSPENTSMPDHLQSQTEPAVRQQSAVRDNPKPQKEPSLRVVYKDERRIVLRSNFDGEDESLLSSYSEQSNSSSSRPRPLNPRQRRTRAGTPRD